MKVSLRLEYACRVAAQLAKCFRGDTVCRIEDLAAKEAISAHFLVQILVDLRKAGVVVSKRGKLGGYILAKAPDEITIADIIRAVEGDIIGVESDRKGDSGPRVAQVWTELAHSLERSASAITLSELAARGGEVEYHI